MNSHQRLAIGGQGYNCLLHFPTGYESRGNWPLILFLHGAGEKGDDIEKLKRNGLPQLLENGMDLPFVVASPQCPRGFFWSTRLLEILLDDITGGFKIDPDRVYLTGISMGGYGVWDLAADQPWRFAAIAPICGGGNPLSADKLARLPAWVFHGDLDEIVPLSESETMVRALRELGGDVRLTVYPETGHDAWTRTYRNPELYAWFLAHTRPACVQCPDFRGEDVRSLQQPGF